MDSTDRKRLVGRSPMRLAVTIISEHEIARVALRNMLASHGIAVTCETVETPLVPNAAADVLHRLILIQCSRMEIGLAACSLLRRDLPTARIAILSAEAEREHARAAFAAGADGVLSDHVGPEAVVANLHLINGGDKVMPSHLVSEMAAAESDPGQSLNNSPVVTLTARELEVLECLRTGVSNKVIARMLGIEEATIKIHIKAVLQKLTVLNRTQAAIWLHRQGGGSPPIGNEPAQGQ